MYTLCSMFVPSQAPFTPYRVHYIPTIHEPWCFRLTLNHSKGAKVLTHGRVHCCIHLNDSLPAAVEMWMFTAECEPMLQRRVSPHTHKPNYHGANSAILFSQLPTCTRCMIFFFCANFLSFPLSLEVSVVMSKTSSSLSLSLSNYPHNITSAMRYNILLGTICWLLGS